MTSRAPFEHPVDRPVGNHDARVVGAILQRNGKIMLGLRAPHRRSYPGCWDLIGGHVEPHETPATAMDRELREEIGIVPVSLRAWSAIPYDQGAGRTLLHVFLVRCWTGEPTIANDEHVDLRWFRVLDAARLPNLALTAYRTLFEQLSRRADP